MVGEGAGVEVLVDALALTDPHVVDDRGWSLFFDAEDVDGQPHRHENEHNAEHRCESAHANLPLGRAPDQRVTKDSLDKPPTVEAGGSSLAWSVRWSCIWRPHPVGRGRIAVALADTVDVCTAACNAGFIAGFSDGSTERTEGKGSSDENPNDGEDDRHPTHANLPEAVAPAL